MVFLMAIFFQLTKFNFLNFRYKSSAVLFQSGITGESLTFFEKF